jgi:four helix bundle protein
VSEQVFRCSGVRVLRKESPVEAHVPIEEMELFRRYAEVADWVWDAVHDWGDVAVVTVGKQLIRAADSVGANLVEGDERYTLPDSLHFFIFARASARETRYWLNRAVKRKLIEKTVGQEKIELIKSAAQLLNRLKTYRRKFKSNEIVKEARSEYVLESQDPFENHWFDEPIK